MNKAEFYFEVENWSTHDTENSTSTGQTNPEVATGAIVLASMFDVSENTSSDELFQHSAMHILT